MFPYIQCSYTVICFLLIKYFGGKLPLIAKLVKERLANKEDILSPYASKANHSDGRQLPETPSPIRTEFQRDRDRIIHCNAFRRLKHKTQVFIAPKGDHYVTRLTHTLEVSQISRTIARALNLNEDLSEAISLGHDLGHTPFGHIGEHELNQIHPDGFRHAEQSLRIVHTLEKNGSGLNLTPETLQGIVSHSKPRGDFLDKLTPENLTLEGQICRIADAVAYLNHDLLDSFRAGILSEDSIPLEVSNVLGTRHSKRLDTMVSDIIASSWDATGETKTSHANIPVISMSQELRNTINVLREFMFETVYIPIDQSQKGETARQVIQLLYDYYSKNSDQIPPEYQGNDRSTLDYIAGMTDQYAIQAAEKIEPGIAKSLEQSLV